MHERFGRGQVINLEVGADKKAEIKFEVGGIKNCFYVPQSWI
jgi:DNA helicase-2/ATP-dependent DNA helicase PcrA